MNPPCYNFDAIQGAISGVAFPLVVGAFAACFVGGFVGQASWYFLHTFILRRFPAWRRFQRAMGKVFA